jgi:membrane protein implicated in regulation of membrane protease activity
MTNMIEWLSNSMVWFILGIVLMAAELIVPGFIVFFFGIGALVTAGLSYFGIVENFALQMVIFLASSIISLFIFRKKFSSSFKGGVSHVMKPGESLDSIKGAKAVVVADIKADGVHGRVEFNGTIWEADADEFIKKGEVVEIIERNNLRIKVKKV